MSAARSFVVLGATGLIGSAVAAHLERRGHRVTSICRSNYAERRGAAADVLVNCSGNSYRFKANQDPRWDFEASVRSVEDSLFDFKVGRYLHVSTVDVYPDRANPAANGETAAIDPAALEFYGFHKWIAEQLVRKFAPRAVILRCGTAIGPGLKKGPLFDILNRQPLHLSPLSTLSLVHTAELARAVETLADIAGPPPVVNVTGTGSVSVADLAAAAGVEVTLAPGIEIPVRRYNISNDLLRRHMPMASSREMALRHINGPAAETP